LNALKKQGIPATGNKAFFYSMKRVVLFILLLYSVSTFAGGDVRVKGRKFLLLPFASAIWQKNPYGDLSIGHPFIKYINHYMGAQKMHSTGARSGGVILIYTKLGAEFNLNLKHEIWAPKATLEIDYRFFCLRGNVEDYLEQGKSNLYLIPEFGLTLSGFISLTGGYNYAILPTGDNILPTYRVSLSVMIPFTISGRNKKQK